MNFFKHYALNFLFVALTVLASLLPSRTVAAPLPEIRSARIVVDREQTAKGSFVVVKIGLPKQAEATAFAVQNPPRIVIDIVGTRIKKNEALPVPSNGIIHQVRLGAHPEKLRVVLDLISDPPNPIDWKTEGQSVVVRLPERAESPEINAEPQTVDLPESAAPLLTENPPVKEVVAPSPTKASTPVKTPIATQTAKATKTTTPSPTATQTPKKSPTQLPLPTVKAVNTPQPIAATAMPATAIPAPPTAPAVATAAPTVATSKSLLPPPDIGSGVGGVSISQLPSSNSNAKLLVRGYIFDYLLPGKTPVLKIALSRDRTQVQISKVDAKTYRIIVPNSGLNSATLALPQFPPADFLGFSMVSAQEVEGQVEITVTVELGTTLGTFVRGNEIWVKRL